MYMGSNDAEGTPKRVMYETESASPGPKRKKKGHVYIEEQTDQEISRKKKKGKEESLRESEDTRADEKIPKSHKAKEAKSDCRDEEASDSKIAELDGRSRTKKKKQKKDRGERPKDDCLVEESLTVDIQSANKKKKARPKDGREESHGQRGVTKTKYQGGFEITENVNEIEDQVEENSSVQALLISETQHSRKKKKKKREDGLHNDGFSEEPISQLKCPNSSEILEQVKVVGQDEKPVKKKKSKVHHQEVDDIAADASSSFIGLCGEELSSSEVIDIEDRPKKKKKKSKKDPENHPMEGLMEESMTTSIGDAVKKKTKRKNGGGQREDGFIEGFVVSDDQGQVDESTDQAEQPMKKKKKKKKGESHQKDDDIAADDVASCIVLHQDISEKIKKAKKPKSLGLLEESLYSEPVNIIDISSVKKKKKSKKDCLLDDHLVEESTLGAQHISEKTTKREDGGDDSQRQHEQEGKSVDQAEEHGKKKKQKKDRGERLLDDRLVEDSCTTDTQHTKKSKRKDGGGEGQRQHEQEDESVDLTEAHGKKKKKPKKDREERLLEDRLVEDSFTADAQRTKKKTKWEDGGDEGQRQHEQEDESVDQDKAHGKKKKKQKKDREERLLDDRLMEDSSCTTDAQHIKKRKWKDGGDEDQRQHEQGGESVDQDKAHSKKKKKQKKDRGEPHQETDDVSSSVGLHSEEPSCSELTGTEDGVSQKNKKKSKKHHKDRFLEDGSVEETLTPDVPHTREKKAKRKDGGHEGHRHHGLTEELGTKRKRQGGSEKKEQVDENEEVEKPVKKKKKKRKDGPLQEAEDTAADEASSTVGLREEEPSRSDFTGTEDTLRRLKKEKSNHHRKRLLENGLVEDDREQSHRSPSSSPDTQDGHQTTQNEGEEGPATLEANTGKRGGGRATMLSYIRPQDVALIHEIFPKIKDKHVIQFICCHELERLKAAKREGITFRSGQFTVDEDEQIRKNAQEFTSRFGIQSPQMLFHPYLYPEMRKTMTKLKTKYQFRIRLAEGLHRFSCHVYIRGVKLFAPVTTKGRFSSEEVRKLKMYREVFGRNWQAIACAMNRDYGSVSMKATQLREGNRGAWSTEETNQLIAAVKESVVDALRKENNGEEPVMIPKRRLDIGIPWFVVENKVETRVWTSCRFRWFGLMLMRMNNYIHPFGKTLKIKAYINIIRWLHDKDVKDYGDVKWYELCDHIGNIPSNYMQKTFHRLKQCVPGWRDMRLHGIVKSLYNDTLPNLEQKLSTMEEFNIEPETKDEFLISEIFREFDEREEKYEE